MKKVLLLGAIYSFCDLYRDIRELGFDAIVCDYYKNAPCKFLSLESYDVSTTDVEKLFEIAKRHEVIGIVAAFSDRNLISSLELSESLCLPSIYSLEIISLLTNKIEMKRKMAELNFPLIPYRVLNIDFDDSELSGFCFPVVIKPVDGYGSNGIILCKDIAAVRSNIPKVVDSSLNYKNTIVLEEYYDADEISITAWVKDGKSYITCIYDVGKNITDVFSLSYVTFPSKYTDMNLEKFNHLVQKLTDCFGIVNGPVTIQCFIGNEGLKVSEYLFRLAGGSPYKNAVLLGGPNLAKMYVNMCVGVDLNFENLFDFLPISDYCYYKYRLLCHATDELKYELDIDKIKENVIEFVDVSIYRKSGEYYSPPLDEGEIVMLIYCKTPKYVGKSYNTLLSEIENEFILYDKKGIQVSFFKKANTDWFPERCGAKIYNWGEM